MENLMERFEAEVRRGMMQVAVMYLLETERYGYDIVKSLKDEGLSVEEGTLYPILRRLEEEGLLSSRWETTGSRPRKYYAVTLRGKDVRERLMGSLRSINASLDRIAARVNGGI